MARIILGQQGNGSLEAALVCLAAPKCNYKPISSGWRSEMACWKAAENRNTFTKPGNRLELDHLKAAAQHEDAGGRCECAGGARVERKPVFALHFAGSVVSYTAAEAMWRGTGRTYNRAPDGTGGYTTRQVAPGNARRRRDDAARRVAPPWRHRGGPPHPTPSFQTPTLVEGNPTGYVV